MTKLIDGPVLHTGTHSIRLTHINVISALRRRQKDLEQEPVFVFNVVCGTEDYPVVINTDQLSVAEGVRVDVIRAWINALENDR